MSGYDLLAGVTVIEVAHLGPSALGGFLADMGADVIKVEDRTGEAVRRSGHYAVGTPDGFGLMHLRWNRGKRSLGLDLKTTDGVRLFKDLVRGADVVIEGMRAGVMKRLGLGWEDLHEVNPRLVFCSVSGLGNTGPYAAMGSHGPSFDAFGGLGAYSPYSDAADGFDHPKRPAVGMFAVSLHAALGTLSAVIKAMRTGAGSFVEVAAAESAAHWLPDAVDGALNESVIIERPGHAGSTGKMTTWPLLSPYTTKDGKQIFFMGRSPEYWEKFFVHVLNRPDLKAKYDESTDLGTTDEEMAVILADIFATKTRQEWLDALHAAGVPVMPVNSLSDVTSDPHFLARDNTYEVDYPGVGTIRLMGTPVRVAGQSFAPTIAPDRGEDSDDVLTRELGLSAVEIEDLRSRGVIV